MTAYHYFLFLTKGEGGLEPLYPGGIRALVFYILTRLLVVGGRGAAAHPQPALLSTIS